MNPLVVTYNMIKPFTDKVIEIAQRTPEELVKSSFIKDTLDPLMANLSGFSEFVGEPIGVYGIQKAKERWLSDPIGSTVALASVVFPAFKQAKSKAVEGIRHSARDVVGTFSPASLGTEARTTAETGRKHLSEMAKEG